MLGGRWHTVDNCIKIMQYKSTVDSDEVLVLDKKNKPKYNRVNETGSMSLFILYIYIYTHTAHTESLEQQFFNNHSI